ncbi:MAG: hypothetical protein AAF483_14715 [Planctomycetota bacterium]
MHRSDSRIGRGGHDREVTREFGQARHNDVESRRARRFVYSVWHSQMDALFCGTDQAV